ncbi:MAG: RidA family protein [bacterium]|nr:RidA family protein [bacterium]
MSPDTTSRRIVSTPNAPNAIGPYSQAVVAAGFVHCSGQIAFDPTTGEIVTGDVAVQADRVLKNLSAVLEAAGSSLARVVKCTVYLRDMGDFQTVNEVYGRYFTGDEAPARACVEVARLPRDVEVEIDCVALV